MREDHHSTILGGNARGSCKRKYQAFCAGFTLIELMVTIAVMGLLMMVAIPSFNEATISSKLGANANNLVASATLARSEAIKRNAVITLCMSSTGTACATTGDWSQGWIVLMGTTVLEYQLANSSNLKISESSGAASLTFQPIGVGATQSRFTVCKASPSAGSQERIVTVSATGYASVKKQSLGVCV